MHILKVPIIVLILLGIGRPPARACETQKSLEVGSWVYQLQAPEPRQIAASGYDLAVVDYSRDGSSDGAFSPEEVSIMKQKSDGRKRIILSYLSIGEAESYRYYWKPEWKENSPSWLFPENVEWGGNYPVEYWRPEWQRIIFGSPEAYLDRVIAAGFDGVYMDRIDVYWELKEARITAQSDMVEFVRDLAIYARAVKPGFLIVPQNAEGLLEIPEYMETIDGIAKESLFFLPGKEGKRPPPEEFEYSKGVLAQAVDAGKFVLTVDYVSEASHIAEVYASGRMSGFVPYVTVRALDRLTVNPGFDPLPTVEKEQ